MRGGLQGSSLVSAGCQKRHPNLRLRPPLQVDPPRPTRRLRQAEIRIWIRLRDVHVLLLIPPVPIHIVPIFSQSPPLLPLIESQKCQSEPISLMFQSLLTRTSYSLFRLARNRHLDGPIFFTFGVVLWFLLRLQTSRDLSRSHSKL